jgi:hypothetical protein
MACVIGNPCYCVLGNSENAVGGLFIGAVGIVIVGFAELSSFSEQITTNAADVMSRLLNEVFCFGALFQRLEHQVQLCLRMKMRACPLKSHMGDTTETAVFHPCQFERTISHWVPSVTGKAWRRQFLRGGIKIRISIQTWRININSLKGASWPVLVSNRASENRRPTFETGLVLGR